MTWWIFLLGQTLQIVCFNLFIVCTFGGHSESAHQPCLWSPLSLLWLVDHCWACHQYPWTSLKMIGLAYIWANICGILTIHTSQMCVNLCGTESFQNMKFNQQSSPVCISNVYHFALLLCWMQMTYWSTDVSSWAGQFCCPVGKARNYPVPHLKEKQCRTHYYQTNLCSVIICYIVLLTNEK